MLLARLEIKDLEPDYFAGELSEELKMDRDKALGISAEVKRTILGSVKKELSDIGIDISLLDKFQIPVIKELSPSAVAAKTAAPTIIQDINSSPKGAPVPANIATIPAAKIATKPPTLSDIGWSKAPAPGPAMAPKPAAPAMPAASSVPPTAASIPKPPAPPAPSAEPAPVMLHEDTTFKASEKNSSFTLARPGVGAEVHLSQGAVPQAPARAAVLEFGGAPAAPANKPPATASSAAAVHYTDFAPGPRNVSQVSPSIPVPPVPAPPKPPMPPAQPPSPQNPGAPIVKDFL